MPALIFFKLLFGLAEGTAVPRRYVSTDNEETQRRDHQGPKMAAVECLRVD